MTNPRGYRGIQLPEALILEIERVIKERPELGYKTKAGFIKDAIRRRLEGLKA